MKRSASIAACAALALCAAAPALASFRVRMPRRIAALRGAVASAPSLPAFPEGSLLSSYVIAADGSAFALYWCGLGPDAALEAASAALSAAGWTRVFVFGAVALFEDGDGNCAAAQALAARGGASEVALLVRAPRR